MMIHAPDIHEHAPPLPMHVSKRIPYHGMSKVQGSMSPADLNRLAPMGRLLKRTYVMLGVF